MSTSLKKVSEALSPSLLVGLVVTGAFFAFVAWDQSHWWQLKEDYSFGWLVPVFVAFVVYDRWARITETARACAAEGSARAVGFGAMLLKLAVWGAIVGGAGMFLLGALYRAGAGTSQPSTLALTIGAIGLGAGAIFLNAPSAASVTPVSFWRDARLQLLAWFTFPLLVWLISAPMVSVVERELNLFLLRKVVAVVSFVFETLGLPIEQRGNVLLLPSGSVGVEDACSGIRSLTACLFAGSFLAAVFLEKWWKKILLVGSAMLLAFVTNLGRGLFLTSWAYRNGADSIGGTVHDVAGYAVLGVTVLGLLCLLPLMNLGSEPEPAASAETKRE